MKNLWIKEFKAKDIETPKTIIEQQCDLLEKLTKGDITAKISEYNGRTVSTNEYINQVVGKIGKNFDNKQLDVQKGLGDINSNTFTFEFFITSRCTPNYKYRVLFLTYGIELYPVIIILDEEIAFELQIEQKINVSSEDEFEEVLGQILNSNKLETIINNLLSIAKKEDEKLELPF